MWSVGRGGGGLAREELGERRVAVGCENGGEGRESGRRENTGF